MTLCYKFGSQEILSITREPSFRFLPSVFTYWVHKEMKYKVFHSLDVLDWERTIWKKLLPLRHRKVKIKVNVNGIGKLSKKKHKISYFCCQIAIRNSINAKFWERETRRERRKERGREREGEIEIVCGLLNRKQETDLKVLSEDSWRDYINRREVGEISSDTE